MKENVGDTDQLVRSFIGPGLMTLGYFYLGGNKGNILGISTIVAGTIIAESALTRTCPANNFLGINTRKKKSPLKRFKEALR